MPFAPIWSKRGPPAKTKANEGAKAISAANSPRPTPHSCVADHRHRLHDWTRGDLTQGDGIEELRSGHPVIGDDGLVLHQGDDDEPTAVGEGADLERHPTRTVPNIGFRYLVQILKG
jgi:hypothetical protein